MNITHHQTGCSTFVLRDSDTFIIGHNLDEVFNVPGIVIFNQRGIQKGSHSLIEWLTGQTPPTKQVKWTSSYGSLSFNAFAKDLPDGGINEAGLYVQENTLVGTQFPEYPDRPRMFMVIWLQYLLDTCATVAQALDTLESFTLDGWTWHFFICDRVGNTAIVEFPEGQSRIYTEDTAPIPVLCNSKYPDELDNLKRYASFSGKEVVDLDNKETKRFVHAAHMLEMHDFTDPVDYAFDILKTLERGGTQWSYVIDVVKGNVYFHTALAQKRKHFSLAAFDYGSENPSKILDIHTDYEGDVTAQFQDFTPEFNRSHLTAQLANLDRDGNLSAALENFGNTPENMFEAMIRYSE
jgi:choloylglycine hydrolase